MKKVFIFLFMMNITLTIIAEEIQLLNNDTGAEEFNNLCVEDQYSSYLKSFRSIIDLYPQSAKWARRIVASKGRNVLPLINRDLPELDFYSFYRKPYDSSLGLIAYILSSLRDNDLLTSEEILYYEQIYEEKIEEYILIYKIIDGTVRVAMSCISYFSNMPSYYYYDSQTMKAYYESKLGLEDIVAGNLDSRWE